MPDIETLRDMGEAKDAGHPATAHGEAATCALCGEPMPPGEEMFAYHGMSGPCPKPPLAQGGGA